MDLIETLTGWPSVQQRHRSAPLFKERELYLSHLLQMGWEARRVLGVASFRIHIVRTMELTSLRRIDLAEIDRAAKRWSNYKGGLRAHGTAPPTLFVTRARQWLRFHGHLIERAAPAGRFDTQLAEFESAVGGVPYE